MAAGYGGAKRLPEDRTPERLGPKGILWGLTEATLMGWKPLFRAAVSGTALNRLRKNARM